MKRFILLTLFLAGTVIADDKPEAGGDKPPAPDGGSTCCDCEQWASLASEQLFQALSSCDLQIANLRYYNTVIHESVDSMQLALSSFQSVLPPDAYVELNHDLSQMLDADSALVYTRRNLESAFQEISDIGYVLQTNKCNCSDSGGYDDPDGPGSSTTNNPSGGCNCVPYLIQIRDRLIMLDDRCDVYFEQGKIFFGQAQQFFSVATNYFDFVTRRLNIPDDNLYQDIKMMTESLTLNLESLLSTTNLQTVYNVALSTARDYPLSNEGVIGLFGLATAYNDTLLQIDQANTLHLIASNIVKAIDYTPQLNFMSNYFDTVQSRYYSLYNKTALSTAFTDNNPFRDTTSWNNYTNFFNRTFTKWADYQYYRNYRNSYTNWFDRIEFALYSIAGIFGRGSISEDFNKSPSEQENALESATNSFSLVSFNSATNGYKTVSESLYGFVSSFRYQPSSTDEIVFLPEFSFASKTRGPFTFKMSDHEPVFELIHNMSGIFWRLVFVGLMIYILYWDFRVLVLVAQWLYKGIRLLFS